jgi:glycosyltransferase involved in cell wall biosynthesis
VLKQSYKVDEVIVVDNNSSDNTIKVIKEKYPEVIILEEKTQGVSNARNKGILNARNKWIAFLDSDDQWMPQKIELQVNKIKKSKNKVFFIHTNEIWMMNDKFLNQKKKHKKLEGYIFEKSLNMCTISPSSVLINNILFKKYGMFNDRLRVCEDYELWLRITSKVPVSLIKKPCVIKYGGHIDQLSKKYWGIDRFRVKALEKLLLYYKLKIVQKKSMLLVLLNKIDIIILGAEKRGNIKVARIYKFKKKYWSNKLRLLNE